MNTAAARANAILLAHARDAYTDQPRTTATVAPDLRCPACGIARAVCASATCIRRVAT